MTKRRLAHPGAHHGPAKDLGQGGGGEGGEGGAASVDSAGRPAPRPGALFVRVEPIAAATAAP